MVRSWHSSQVPFLFFTRTGADSTESSSGSLILWYQLMSGLCRGHPPAPIHPPKNAALGPCTLYRVRRHHSLSILLHLSPSRSSQHPFTREREKSISFASSGFSHSFDLSLTCPSYSPRPPHSLLDGRFVAVFYQFVPSPVFVLLVISPSRQQQHIHFTDPYFRINPSLVHGLSPVSLLPFTIEQTFLKR